MTYKNINDRRDYLNSWRSKRKDKTNFQARSYYQKNRENILKKVKERSIKNHDKLLGYWKTYRIKNREKILNSRKESYIKNKEKLKRQRKKWREKNREKIIQKRKEWRTKNPYYKYKKYGVNIVEMAIKQEGKCKICSRETKLYVDHSHKTNQIRGLLCQQCNTALGMFQDNIDNLKKALIYLTK